MDGKAILDLPMEQNDSKATTIRGYLKALLTDLWEEGECFSGKRPFGNSGWEWDLYRALVKGGAIKGRIDEDGLQDCDEVAGNNAIFEAIDAL
jgi:hypothetical protein